MLQTCFSLFQFITIFYKPSLIFYPLEDALRFAHVNTTIYYGGHQVEIPLFRNFQRQVCCQIYVVADKFCNSKYIEAFFK